MRSLRLPALVACFFVATFSASTAFERTKDTAVPNDHHLALLVHTAVSALDHANRTGNYTVLRAMSAPAFQRANDANRLAVIFSRLRGQNISLSPAILYDPMLVTPARLDRKGHLRLTGYFPTTPLRIHFDLRFERVGAEWRLFGISIQPRQAHQVPAG